MNPLFFLIFISIIVFNALELKAQGPPDWNTLGNAISVGTEYLGATNTSTTQMMFQHNANIGALSRFEWYTNISGTTNERMRLTNAGWLGVAAEDR